MHTYAHINRAKASSVAMSWSNADRIKEENITRPNTAKSSMTVYEIRINLWIIDKDKFLFKTAKRKSETLQLMTNAITVENLYCATKDFLAIRNSWLSVYEVAWYSRDPHPQTYRNRFVCTAAASIVSSIHDISQTDFYILIRLRLGVGASTVQTLCIRNRRDGNNYSNSTK